MRTIRLLEEQLGAVGRLAAQNRVCCPPQRVQVRAQLVGSDVLRTTSTTTFWGASAVLLAPRGAHSGEAVQLGEEVGERILWQGVREVEQQARQQPCSRGGHRVRLGLAGACVRQQSRPRKAHELLAALLRAIAANGTEVGGLRREHDQDRPVDGLCILLKPRLGDEPSVEDVASEPIGGVTVKERAALVGPFDEARERADELGLGALGRTLELGRDSLEHPRPAIASTFVGALGERRTEEGLVQQIPNLARQGLLVRHPRGALQTGDQPRHM